MNKIPTLTGAALAIAMVSGLGVGEAWAQFRDDAQFGTRGRPSTVLELMKRNRTTNAPTVRQPPGSAPVRQPPGFTTGSSATSARPITSPGVEEPILPGTATPAAEKETTETKTPTPSVGSESVPQFPKPEEPAATAGAPASDQPAQAPDAKGAPPAEAPAPSGIKAPAE